MHVQFDATLQGSWELAVGVGDYKVTVGLGDAASVFSSVHAATAEGQSVVAPYTPTATDRQRTGSVMVQMTDGRLTVSPTGGTNTKITFLEVRPATTLLPVRVDFDAPTSVPPSGWTLDFGRPYAARGNLVSGWVTQGARTPLDLTANGRQRSTTGRPTRRSATSCTCS